VAGIALGGAAAGAAAAGVSVEAACAHAAVVALIDATKHKVTAIVAETIEFQIIERPRAVFPIILVPFLLSRIELRHSFDPSPLLPNAAFPQPDE